MGAGTVAAVWPVFCMNPLDLFKAKFQVSTRVPGSGIGRGIWLALRDIHASEGWQGLYRGFGPNIAGNASSWVTWGLYFLLCVLHSIPFVFYSYISGLLLTSLLALSHQWPLSFYSQALFVEALLIIILTNWHRHRRKRAKSGGGASSPPNT
jgi:hypothetical protein